MGPLAVLGIMGGLGLGNGIINYLSNKDTNEANAAAVAANNRMNLQIARETNQSNKDIYQKQFQDQLQMWHMQNAYNDPSQEVARLRAAGMNPSLTFGQAAQAGSMSIPSASPAIGATMQAPQYSDILGSAVGSAINNTLSMLSTYGSASKDIAEAKGVTIDNATRDQYNRAQIDQAMAEIRAKLASSETSKAEKGYLQAMEKKVGQEALFLEDSHDISLENLRNQGMQSKAAAHALEAQAESFAAEKAYKDSLTKLNDIQIKYEPQKLEAAIKNTIADTKLKLASAYNQNEQGKTQQSVRDLNYENKDKIKQERMKLIEDTFKTKLENIGINNANKIFDATKDYVIKEAEYAAEQAELDFYNPFKYVGGLLGGSGAAAIKLMK